MMTNVLGSYLNYCPEAWLLLGLSVVILIDLFLPLARKGVTFYLSEILLIVVAVMLFKTRIGAPMSLFAGHYMVDQFALGFKFILLVIVFLVFAYAKKEASFGEHMSEFYILSLLSLTGALVLVSASSLISLYLGLELLSLPLYALVALKRDSALAAEAAMKYFVMGALASALLLFGFSLVYGLTGSILLPTIASQVVVVGVSPLLLLAFVLVVIAGAFKLGVFPFHMWVPDVYQGTTLSVVAFLGSVAKLGAFALLFRFLVLGTALQQDMVQEILIVLGLLSLIVGNVVALVQKNIRRILAYSTVANMGIIFIALGLDNTVGQVSSAFYLISYAFMSLAIFGLLMVLLPRVENLDELKGLHAKHPFTAALFLLAMLSFAGIPPLLGFDAKLMIIMALVQQGHLALSLIVVVLSVVGAAYYLRIVKAVYFEKADRHVVMNQPHGMAFALSGLNVFALLLVGLFPSLLMYLVQGLFI